MLKTALSRTLLALLLLYAAAPALAEDARALLASSEQRHHSQTMRYEGDLTVTARDGRTRTKSWKSYREGFAGKSKVLVRFTAPPEVRGVGFLSLAREGENSDQWLYLPSMKRERRIASQDRDASFVGTDFTYEDMEEFDHTKFEVRLLPDQAVDGVPCRVIEAVPARKAGVSAYARRILYLRADILYLIREDYFRAGQDTPAKRLLLTGLEEMGGHWAAKRLTMTDLSKGSSTTVNLNGISFDEAQPPDRFTLKNLTREGID